MQKILAWIGVLSICAYIFKIDLNPFLSLLKLPGFNLPGNQQQTQQQQQTPPTENQTLPQVQQTPQTPQAVQTPQVTPSPKNQWGIGIRGAITTPFGATKNETSLGNPDFTDDENSEGSE